MALTGDESRELSRRLIDSYFRTVPYPYTRHHIDSYDQFLQQDMLSIIKSQNPILILKDLINESTNTYKYKVEIFVGGENGTAIEIGTPTISLQNTDEVRVLFPNEARLRNLTYASQVYADIIVKITYTSAAGAVLDLSPPAETFQKWPLFKIPIMLHSRYCILNNKPREFLKEVGECPYDNGGYFIIDGAEKVLITRQEQAFNTLYVTPQTDPKVSVYASISCLSDETRQVKRVAFALMREVEKDKFTAHATIQVSLPFVRKTIPLFVLFRALGYQSDYEILKMIFPDFNSPEAKLLLPKLQPSIIEGFPFLNTYTAVQYIKTLTKGFSVAHVLDIIKNQLFIHMPNDSASQALFLGDCVRKILRVAEGYDNKTDRDDTRNQRCLTSGFLVQELFNNSYKLWIKASALAIDKEYNYNKQVLYKDENFKNIFQAGNDSKIFLTGLLSDMIGKGFKGKWGTGLGEEKTGVLQAMSRLSYVDFMSHCRRVILDFDTGMKLTGPRKLHPSQYGYLCTSETPTGASIGITKNLSIMTAISTASQTTKFFEWLRTTGRVYKPDDVTEQQRIIFVPVYINGGMFGYTAKPYLLTRVLKAFKRTACLPYSVSISFSIRDRIVYIYMDAGRPLRPLVWLDKAVIPVEKLRTYPTWRDLVMGNLEIRKNANLESTEFIDPLAGKTNKLEDYPDILAPNTGAIEYVDPYEQNETFIANNPAYITPETTHMEVHPSTIMSMMTSLIPFAPHNQSPRNQLSCSQSKQGLSIYATNWRNRFDNTAHVLCYGEMPLTRTIYNNYLGEGKMAYGMNIILAIACWTGYNQEDGIVMNYDAIRRGLFRSMAFRSYEAHEEDDEKSNTKTRFGNPALIGTWKDLKPGLDYSKLDERGIIKEGEYVDENTVIVGAYLTSTLAGTINDASITPQVWTRGRVEKVVIMVNNMGLRLVKIRVVQDRMPELGDKFCLTDDHEVLTQNRGWVDINLITKQDLVAQRNPITQLLEYINPSDLIKMDYDGEMYEIVNENDKDPPLIVSPNHKLYGVLNIGEGDDNIIPNKYEAKEIYKYYQENDKLDKEFGKYSYSLYTILHLIEQNNQHSRIIEINKLNKNPDKLNKIYCITVPSSIFLVRRKGAETAYWTGNSNRHGQKGTIGAMLRGHDMPRTESGIVPDMIMNPHAIPSRMTIAQNLEQLLGKTAALSGAIGDGTSFMNDGSPQEAIGGILEEIGFEKYGNEVMYNGATGEQIQAAIFIGPVYGMRLKHMVEDKWNARGKGKKEVRTHQPTGGRGAQGGLKIGEMDRDAIIAHGGMAFVKESFMERSDGAKIPLCVACGTIPIYNPRLNIAICPLCDGPVKYIGDTVNTLEILPPLGRPKSKIVEVEMPYSTKLLTQEQETYLNLTMRYITTSGVQRLKPLEFSGTSSEVVKELPRLILPETVAPAYIEEVPKAVLTVEQLRSMGAQLATMSEAERAAIDTVLDDTEEGVGLEQQAQMDAMSDLQNGVTTPVQETQNQVIIPGEGEGVVVGGLAAPSLVEIMGGDRVHQQMEGEGYITGAQIPSGGRIINIRTDPAAMMADGIPIGGFDAPRQVRRSPYRGNGGMSMSPMMPAMQRYTPMAGGSNNQPVITSGSNVSVKITKLE
jgi:DNA-directed RNA polymerase II subunit RPB2